MIRSVLPSDAGRIAEIYNYYIEKTIITFEEEPVTEDDILQRIEVITQKGFPFFAYIDDSDILMGYAYLSNWRSRSAYDITLETSVYIDSNQNSKGLGTILYSALIEEAKKIGVHSLIGGISLPNEISRKLHEKFGFELVGNFRECGKKFNRYIDVEFWQLFIKP